MAKPDNLDEAARTIRRAALALLVYAAFSMGVMGFDPTVKFDPSKLLDTPYFGKITYLGFFVAGPIIVSLLAIYMHVFVNYWFRGIGSMPAGQEYTPTLFTLDTLVAKFGSYLLVYCLTPFLVWRFFLASTISVNSDDSPAVPIFNLVLAIGFSAAMTYKAFRNGDFHPHRLEPWTVGLFVGAVLAVVSAGAVAIANSRSVDAETDKLEAATPEPTPALEAYAFYGIRFGGEWTERYFEQKARTTDDPPKPGDCVVATGQVNKRTGYIELTALGWKNKPKLGSAIKPGEELYVVETKQVLPGYYWMRFATGCPAPPAKK